MNITSTPRRIRRALLASVFTLVTGGAQAADLTVSAAASLTNAFREIGPAFEAAHPGTQVLFNFAASDALLAQIAKGAPADVFAAADQDAMDRAEQQKLLFAGSRRNFAHNTLVLITPSDSKLRMASLADLQQADVRRIAIGNPSGVPAGRYTRSALEAARLWEPVQAKAVFAQNVRQSLDYVARGEVEAGFVYATDAAVHKDKVRVALTIRTSTPISYPIAVVAGGPNPGDAARFLTYVMSPAGQAVLAKHGFQKP